VLKHCIQKRKIALLDERAGRIDALLFYEQAISIGTVLQYRVIENNNRHHIITQEMIAAPLVMAQADILFLHHLLEVCYYSIPAGTFEPRVFDDILRLYEEFSPEWGMPEKIILLFRIILSIGCYTEHALLVRLLSQATIREVCMGPIDKLIDNLFAKTINLECAQHIHDWLQICIAGHPYSDQFKTAHFLEKAII